jgi:hypothetical protein
MDRAELIRPSIGGSRHVRVLRCCGVLARVRGLEPAEGWLRGACEPKSKVLARARVSAECTAVSRVGDGAVAREIMTLEVGVALQTAPRAVAYLVRATARPSRHVGICVSLGLLPAVRCFEPAVRRVDTLLAEGEKLAPRSCIAERTTSVRGCDEATRGKIVASKVGVTHDPATRVAGAAAAAWRRCSRTRCGGMRDRCSTARRLPQHCISRRRIVHVGVAIRVRKRRQR